ncbi:hypothetical protein MNBD_GAMMA11-499 [hydrothermal vent metagenome]|uniref:YbaK/aminoacyl-tRNA synthetase-associated domain-containing protein n=1 Tax=hydrothermal vent metagenome TaxID=652676 RepID=A0A3B0XWI5_9ZZZZ
MPSRLLKEFLNENNIKYISISHSMAFTAVDVAKSAHVHSRDMAKTVIIKVDGKMAMAVVPANYKVDLDILRHVLNTPQIELAQESEFISHFKDCEVGAMPPFGCLYDMDVYISERLSEDEHITFNAGSHLEVIQLNYRDYEKLVKPKFIFLNN